MAKKGKKAKKKAKPAKKKKPGASKKSRNLRYWEGDVPDEFAFFMCDGRVLKNLKGLTKALDEISDDTFWRHANNERNDFSNWIRDIMHHQDLAHNLLGKNKLETKETILVYIKRKTGKKLKS